VRALGWVVFSHAVCRSREASSAFLDLAQPISTKTPVVRALGWVVFSHAVCRSREASSAFLDLAQPISTKTS
jgi:hypothetical protein